MREGRSESSRGKVKKGRVDGFFFSSASVYFVLHSSVPRLAVMSGASNYKINFKPAGGGGRGFVAHRGLGFMCILQAIVSPQMWPFPYH